MITVASVVERSPEQVFSELDDEIVLLHVDSGAYFSANAVGAQIWRAIETPTRVSDVCADLQSRFDVPAERCESDVLEFLNHLESKGLVVIVD